MRYLGIDYGTARVGLALGDDGSGVAAPWKVLTHGTGDLLVQLLARTVQEEGVDAVVLGYPTTLRGAQAHMAHMIDEFAADLRDAMDVPLYLEDERMSSKLADRSRMAGASASRDALAAAAILQNYLDRAKRDKEV